MAEEYLRLKEAAEYLGVSRVKLSQLAKEGLIGYTTSPFDKRVKLFNLADLDEFKRAPRPSKRPEGPSAQEAA